MARALPTEALPQAKATAAVKTKWRTEAWTVSLNFGCGGCFYFYFLCAASSIGYRHFAVILLMIFLPAVGLPATIEPIVYCHWKLLLQGSASRANKVNLWQNVFIQKCCSNGEREKSIKNVVVRKAGGILIGFNKRFAFPYCTACEHVEVAWTRVCIELFSYWLWLRRVRPEDVCWLLYFFRSERSFFAFFVILLSFGTKGPFLRL